MIFIGYDHHDRIISIVSAESEKSANAYWQGLNWLPYRTECFDLEKDRENERLGFVTPILKTIRKSTAELEVMCRNMKFNETVILIK